jgi:hypothetical protein
MTLAHMRARLPPAAQQQVLLAALEPVYTRPSFTAPVPPRSSGGARLRLPATFELRLAVRRLTGGWRVGHVAVAEVELMSRTTSAGVARMNL